MDFLHPQLFGQPGHPVPFHKGGIRRQVFRHRHGEFKILKIKHLLKKAEFRIPLLRLGDKIHHRRPGDGLHLFLEHLSAAKTGNKGHGGKSRKKHKKRRQQVFYSNADFHGAYPL